MKILQLALPILYKNSHFYTQAGYKNALKQLHTTTHKTFKHYGQTRNMFSIAISMLNSYLSLMSCPSDKYYSSMNHISKDFMRELYWRDFYIRVTRSLPKV